MEILTFAFKPNDGKIQDCWLVSVFLTFLLMIILVVHEYLLDVCVIKTRVKTNPCFVLSIRMVCRSLLHRVVSSFNSVFQQAILSMASLSDPSEALHLWKTPVKMVC